MSSYTPPSIISSNFNTNYYANLSGSITLGAADARYLRLSGGTVTGQLNVAGNQLITSNTGDLLSLTASDSTGRSSIKYTLLSNTLETGLRGPTSGSFANCYYRYGNGSFRYVQDVTSGDAQNFGRLTVDTSGSHLTLKNSSFTPFLEATASNILRLIANTMSMNLDITTGLRIDTSNTSAARSRLDLGSALSDKTIGIFNNTTSFYGISANNSQLQFSSNGNFAWYTGCTDASPILTNIASLTNTGNLILNRGLFIQNGTLSNTGKAGIGCSLYMPNTSTAELVSYDYTGLLWKDLKINNTMYVNGTNSYVQIGSNPGNPLYPLAVAGGATNSFSNYGYLNTTGAGSSVGSTGSVSVSIYSQNRVWASEFNAFSDRRLKENFIDVSTDDAIEFIKTVKAKNYNWKADSSKKQCTGFVAQDILKFGKFGDLVSIGEDEDLEEEIDDDGFVSPAKHRFLVSYQSAVPVLHAAISQLIERIERIEAVLTASSDKPKRTRIKKD